jgi:hypothetical protein
MQKSVAFKDDTTSSSDISWSSYHLMMAVGCYRKYANPAEDNPIIKQIILALSLKNIQDTYNETSIYLAAT